MKNYKVCIDRVIPDELQSRHAMTRDALVESVVRQTNRNSVREVLRDLDPSQPIGPVEMALINFKKWPTGSVLRCRFLEGSKTQRARVVEKAHLWQEHANIHIDFVKTNNEHIRIAFTPGQGSWSAVGTDALNTTYFPKHQPTMNYGWLKDDTNDIEYERVVVHEFGHALGCVHEHQSPNVNLKWNKKEVYAYFSGPPNYWKKEEIDHNVLEKYSANGITATIFDENSIMLYQFPQELFLDHHSTPNNTHLSEKDKKLIAQMYPF